MQRNQFRRITFVLLLSALMALVLLAFGRQPAGAASIGSTVAANPQTADSITLRVDVPAYRVSAAGRVQATGLDAYIETEGAPRLPFYTRLVAVPAGQTVMAEVTAERTRSRHVAQVEPAPTISVDVAALEPNGPQPTFDKTYVQDPAVYGTDALFPNVTHELSDVFAYAGKQYVRLTLYPLRWNPVAGEMVFVESYSVRLRFADAVERADRAPDAQLTACCGLERQPVTTPTQLPVGQTAYKIAVDQAGIYELTYAQLQAAGFPVTTVNPKTFKMLTAGQPVAHQFVGDNDNSFEPGELVRFYGWPYDGHRIEKQYITDNYFWLWAGATPTLVTTQAAVASGTVRSATTAELTVGPDRAFYATYTDRWSLFPNQPDAWYWQRLDKASATPSAQWTFPITLPNPINTADPALVTVEIMGWLGQSHSVSASVNGVAIPPTAFSGQLNKNLTVTLPHNQLVNGVNNVTVTSNAPGTSWVYINRITAEYQRAFTAVNNRLPFNIAQAGPSQITFSGFSGNPQLIWNISNRLQPVVITPQSGSFGATVAVNHAAGAKFIAVGTGGVLTPKAITPYNVIDIDPAAGADWVAVTHSTLRAQADRLAAHRASAQFGAHSTHVVNVNDVFNQYGYGLPTPSAIRAYMANAYANWPERPRYLLLFGDASGNPRQLACPSCPRPWQPELVPTFLLFADRFLGQIPSDHPFSLLAGDDELSDIAVGRLTVENLTDATTVVNKIIQFDTNQLTPQAWMTDLLFLSDDTDAAGNFCVANEMIINMLDDSLTPVERCLQGVTDSGDDATLAETQSMRSLFFNMVNITGTVAVNYRGHGGIDYWGPIDGAKPRILLNADSPTFTNAARPVVFITADCLDGHFAWNGLTSVAETYLRNSTGGSAAQWSSTGLGYLYEYNVMHTGFYDAVLNEGLTALGDASAFAKVNYTSLQYNYSMAYAMTLQGDPAMQLMRPDLAVNLDSNSNTTIGVNGTVTYVLTIRNNSVYPAPVTFNIQLPLELELESVTGNVGNVSTGLFNRSTIRLNNLLGFNESETITVTIRAISGSGSTVNLTMDASSPGSDLNTSNQSIQSTVRITSSATAVQLAGNQVERAASSLSLIVPVLLALLSVTCYAAWRRLRRLR